MQAVILAGGRGTRLRPLTDHVPKPLLPLMGRPLLEHLLERLPQEVDEVLLTVSYLADHLRAWAKDSKSPALAGRTLHVIEERKPLGTAGAVVNCRDRIDGTFFVLNGDLLSDVDLEAQLRAHRQSDRHGTLALHPVDDPSRYGVAPQDEAGRILRFVEKPAREAAPSHWVNAGVYVLEADVLARIPTRRAVSIEREVFPALVAEDPGLYGFRFDGLWVDCGTPESYLEAHRLLLDRAGAPYAAQGVRFDDAVPQVSDSFIGAGARIGAGASIRSSVLHERVRVDAGADLLRTIVGPDARIGPQARLRDVVVGPGDEVVGTRSPTGAPPTRPLRTDERR